MTRDVEIKFELAFPKEFDVTVLEELPPDRPVEYEFSRTGRIIDGGVLVRVSAGSRTWEGIASNAPESIPRAHSGVYSTPSPHVVCIIARGDAYFIDVREPQQWCVLDDAPVIAVKAVTEAGLLLIATPWRVIAYGAAGVVWRTSRIAIDGLQLGDVEDGMLTGLADPGDSESREFVIELRTGYHRGGFPFPG
jgi:hypothetical protein